MGAEMLCSPLGARMEERTTTPSSGQGRWLSKRMRS